MVTCRQRDSVNSTLEYLVDDSNLSVDETKGMWMGSAVTALFHSNQPEFSREGFEAILEGRDPLTREPIRSVTKIPALELTITLDKSISIAALCTNHPLSSQIIDAFVQSIAGAVRLIENCIQTTKHKMPEFASGLACVFIHRSSRWTDPHLHAHVVIPNLARFPSGKWAAVGNKGIFAATRLLNAYVSKFMLRALRTIGLPVEWNKATSTCKLPFIPDNLIRSFSKGREAVLESPLDKGYSRPSKFANFHVRPEKPPTIDFKQILPDSDNSLLHRIFDAAHPVLQKQDQKIANMSALKIARRVSKFRSSLRRITAVSRMIESAELATPDAPEIIEKTVSFATNTTVDLWLQQLNRMKIAAIAKKRKQTLQRSVHQTRAAQIRKRAAIVRTKTKSRSRSF